MRATRAPIMCMHARHITLRLRMMLAVLVLPLSLLASRMLVLPRLMWLMSPMSLWLLMWRLMAAGHCWRWCG